MMTKTEKLFYVLKGQNPLFINTPFATQVNSFPNYQLIGLANTIIVEQIFAKKLIFVVKANPFADL